MAEGAQIRGSGQRLRNISAALRTFHIPPYEYLPIGLSITSENLYQNSLCMPKTVRSVLWLRHQDPMVEEWVLVIATFSIPALLLGIFPGDVGLGPGGICIIRFFLWIASSNALCFRGSSHPQGLIHRIGVILGQKLFLDHITFQSVPQLFFLAAGKVLSYYRDSY